jgi:hypothetical protein
VHVKRQIYGKHKDIQDKGSEMGEPATKITKSIGRIAVCSIGGVITIFGFMLCLGALLELPDDILKNVILFFAGVLVLSIGLYLCFLVIKPMQYFVKSQKMSGEEKVIENIKTYMKKGKSRIATCSVFLVFMIAISIWIVSMGNKLTESMTQEHIKVLIAAKLLVVHYLFGLFMGFLVFMLINEFAGFTRNKHKLTLNMWDRIAELENEVSELKSGLKSENQE